MSNSVRPHKRQPTRLPVPGILQARTPEWVAIAFSSAWKWKVKVKSLSHVRLLATPWTAAYQAPLSMGFSRQEYWSGMPLPSPDAFLGHCKTVCDMRAYLIPRASLIAQLVKNLPTMSEAWVRSLTWEDPLEKGKSNHSSILAWRIPWTIHSPWGCKESDTTEWLSLSLFLSQVGAMVFLVFLFPDFVGAHP